MKTLIVFFGHKNDEQGRLSQHAIARCETAARLWKENPGAEVLVTAAFARHAIASLQPHWVYLAEELVRQGVPRESIVSPFSSATTIDEALRARYVLEHGDYDLVFGVTSRFHAERVSFLLARLLRDKDVELVVVESPASEADLAGERISSAYVRDTWVQPPLYRHGAEFPRDAHAGGREMLRRQETTGVALAAFMALLIVVVPVLYALADGALAQLAVLVAGAVALLVTRALLKQADFHARCARMYVRAIEVGFNQPGYVAGSDITDLHRHSPPSEWALRALPVGALAMLALLAIDWLVLLWGA